MDLLINKNLKDTYIELYIMPRKEHTEKLEKVVSSNISLEDFQLLNKYAKILYNKNMITQPTISHIVRLVIKQWASFVRKKEEKEFSPFQTSVRRGQPGHDIIRP